MARPIVQQFILESIQKESWSSPVIDLGAGDYSSWYRGLFNGVKYITLDIKQNPNNHIDIIADILDMSNVEKNHYGVALLLETLEHIKNPFLAFEKISQIIRPGGMLICTTVAAWVQHDYPADYWRFMPEGLKLLCELNNLKIFNKFQSAPTTSIPCNVGVAAIKEG